MIIDINELESCTKQLEEIKAAGISKAKSVIQDSVKKLFEAYPNVKSASWRQYTPYFNDGDTCTFSAHIDYIDMVFERNGEEIEEEEVYGGYYKDAIVAGKDTFVDKKVYDGYDSVTRKTKYRTETVTVYPEYKFAYELQRVLGACEPYLQDVFGDHIKVTVVAPGKIEIEDHDHD
jgi:hypothetical protein